MSSTRRRSLSYIRLAAWLAGQPAELTSIEMSLEEIEDLLGRTLPDGARWPSWWRNDQRRLHSRAWLLAGWEIAEVHVDRRRVVFARRPEPDSVRPR
jgi:hypothetical protein